MDKSNESNKRLELEIIKRTNVDILSGKEIASLFKEGLTGFIITDWGVSHIDFLGKNSIGLNPESKYRVFTEKEGSEGFINKNLDGIDDLMGNMFESYVTNLDNGLYLAISDFNECTMDFKNVLTGEIETFNGDGNSYANSERQSLGR